MAEAVSPRPSTRRRRLRRRWWVAAIILWVGFEIVTHMLPMRFRADFLFDGYKGREIAAWWQERTPYTGAGTRVRATVTAPPYRESVLPPRGEAVRVVCMGDSTAYGLHVAEEEAYCPLLEGELARRWNRPVESFNFGVPGSTSYIAVDGVLADALAADPDLLVASYVGLNSAVHVPVAEHRYTRHRDPLRNTLRLLTTYRLLEETGYRIGLRLRGEPKVPKVALADHEGHLEQLYDRALEEGIQVVVLGQWTTISDQPGGIWTRERFDRYRDTTRDVAEARDIPFVDIEPLVGEDAAGFFNENEIHYTALGHRRIAQALADVIVEDPSW